MGIEATLEQCELCGMEDELFEWADLMICAECHEQQVEEEILKEYKNIAYKEYDLAEVNGNYDEDN